jgi:hypothetical protein
MTEILCFGGNETVRQTAAEIGPAWLPADVSNGWKADIAKGNHEAHSQTGGAVMSAEQMAFERHAGEVPQ